MAIDDRQEANCGRSKFETSVGDVLAKAHLESSPMRV